MALVVSVKVMKKIQFCDFTDYDFERFLWPYKPQYAYVRYDKDMDTGNYLNTMSGYCYPRKCLPM